MFHGFYKNNKLFSVLIFLKDHVTLNIGVLAVEKSVLPSQEYIFFYLLKKKIIYNKFQQYYFFIFTASLIN